MNSTTKIIISGGGTGGHIFPAIAIANALKKLDPDISILFVGAEGRMEMEKVPDAGYQIKGLEIQGLKRSLSLSNLGVVFKYFKSIKKAKKIIKDFRPDAAVGVGGYASAPLLKAAQNIKIPYIIQEQNSYAGVTNRMLSGKAQKICVAYEGMDKFFPAHKIILTGNPVRENISKTRERDSSESKKWFGFSPDQKCILITGGSLGSATLNKSVKKWVEQNKESETGIIWQCGKHYHSPLEEYLKHEKRENVRLFQFISEMDIAYSAADLVISRAGACTISELAIAGKAVIFVPSPNVAEDHQTHNAYSLVKKDAALMVPDKEAQDKLMETATRLLNDPDRIKGLQNKIGLMAIENSDIKIAEEILKLIDHKKETK
jgi:UDP-N-acetylglucosamine--N-acetylmuramyl-(pentapeptide) pyrophosphoryl-undecaprenol N-acetylglucosamine transferase